MKTDTDFNINRVIKYAIIMLVSVVVMVALMALAKIWFIYSTFGYFTYKISSVFGTDLLLSRAVAALVTVITLFFIPWTTLFLLFGKRKKEILLATVIIGSVCFLVVYFGTGNVFFDRVTGQPARYYIRTREGFKFSMNEDFDPKLGIKYKLINQEIIKEYLFWEDFGKQRSIPEVKSGKYFDMLTGEPIVWYIEKSGMIHLFSLPGHDPTTGRALNTITPEIADRVDAEKRAKEEKEKKMQESKPMGERALDHIISSENIKNDPAVKNRPPHNEKSRNFEYEKALEYLLSTPAYSLSGEIKSNPVVDRWYRDDKNSLDFTRNWLKLGSRGVFSTEASDWTPDSEVYVEKAQFVEPKATIVCVCYRGLKGIRREIDGYIVDAKGIRHDPLRIYPIDGVMNRDDIGNYIYLTAGVTTKVLYVLEYVSPEDMSQGEFFGSWGGISLKFSRRN